MKVAVESASVVYADFSSGERIRILHVDNDAPFLAVAKHCLEEQGPFQVDSALSAKEALEKLRNADYDAVVADYQMPGKNGLELLKELRQEGIDVPFILFTCKGKEEIAIEALNSGVEQYIDKQGNAEATYEELKHIILSAVKRRRIEKRLKKSENLLSQITDNMQDLLMLTDENLIITYASSSYKVVLGYEPSELVGKRIHNFVHPDDLTTVIQTVKKAFENRSGTKIESRIRHADGSYIVLEGIGKVLTDENGQIIGAVLNSRDITERKKAEEIVRDAEEKFRQLFNTMPSGVAVYKAVDDGDDFIFTDLNQTVEKIERVNKQDLLGKRVTKVFPGIEKFGLFSVFQRVFRTGQAEYFPSAIYRDKRTPESWRENWVYKLPNGNIVAVYNDITERKKIEQALSKSEEKYRKMFEEAIDAVFIADAETGIIIDCNRAATKLTGRAKSEYITKKRKNS
jgi:PAS domain S-box-containing protein